MTDLDKEERRFLNSGIEIAASVAGAAAGLAVGGAPGAITGAAVGPALSASVRWAAGEWTLRQLSRREGQRVVSALDFAAAEIERRLESGEKPRDDGFFEEGGDGQRPSAEELLEGTLLAAQRAHEERSSSLDTCTRTSPSTRTFFLGLRATSFASLTS